MTISMRKSVIGLVLIATLLAGAKMVTVPLTEIRYSSGITDLAMGQEITPGEFLATRAAGPLRTIATPVLWADAMEAFKQQDWHRALTLYNFLSRLYPHVAEVWILNGWNMVVNISYDEYSAGRPDQAFAWIERGLEYLAQGADRNPAQAHLRYYYGRMLAQCLDPTGKNQEQVGFYRSRFEERGRDLLKESVAQLDQAAALAPDHEECQRWRLRTHEVLAGREEIRGHPGAAIHHLEQALVSLQDARSVVNHRIEDPRTAPSDRLGYQDVLELLHEKENEIRTNIERIRDNSSRMEPTHPQ